MTTTKPELKACPIQTEIENSTIHALKYVQSVLGGLETETNHVWNTIIDVKTRTKALAKIDNKLDIFETLEGICEDAITRPTTTEEKIVINDAGLAEAVDRVKAHIIGRKVTGMQKELTAALETLINHAVKGEKVAMVTVSQMMEYFDHDEHKGIENYLKTWARNYPNGIKIIDGGT